MNLRQPINALPEGYHRVFYMHIESPETMLRLQNLSLYALLFSVIGVVGWILIALQLRQSIDFVLPLPDLVWWAMIIGVLFIHEWLHGLAIAYYGQRTQYGVKWLPTGKHKIPYAFYATSGGGYFLRDAFKVIALTPLIVISLVGGLLCLVIPASALLPMAGVLITNGAGAVGDVWMWQIVSRYPPDALIYDDADSIAVYTQEL